MLITLCYVYLWVRYQKCYTLVIRRTLRRLCGGSRGGFTFCAVKPDSGRRASRVVYRAFDDLSKWTLLMGSPMLNGPALESIAFIIEATSGQAVGSSLCTSNKKVLKWSDYCHPLACSPGLPYRAVAEATIENFSRLGVAFLEDRLQMENGLIPDKIVSVLLGESALRDLSERRPSTSEYQVEPLSLSNATEIIFSEPPPCEKELGDAPLRRKSSARLSTAGEGERRGSCDFGEVTDPLPDHHHMEGHHLHLSSCHECLELENSTILSVKYASVENIPDLPDDYEGMDSDEIEDDEESFVGQTKRVNVSGKPPNVLVYAGGCVQRFEQVRRLLAECVDTDSYTLYPLRPQQVLSEPWLDSALLLVLATEELLTPQLQERFLAYLAHGGRILGLSSSFSITGLKLVSKKAQRNQICRLSFTKADSTELELSVLASGGVYVRDPSEGHTGQVELWGELLGDVKDMAIVRFTHGERGGEAVLCQVRLETAPDSQHVRSPKEFDELKMSNALRYEVLTEILTSLGLSCELSQIPPPSPIYVFSPCPERRGSFLTWLRRKLDEDGTLTAPKASLKVLSGGDSQTELPEGVFALLPDPVEPQPEQFNLQAYTHHLHTRTLGQTLLYTEVNPTTMDLLEGLMLQLPEEMGLIAVALRQTKGRGRGGNAWLSPLGCAMFTLHAQIPINSSLGQRIPFLQHLVALSVVEAVRTLPGYESIDLRVKWPNDIYYSNLMKLGGVLVNSTVMGPTFHLLIGCGFNVSNSNPTICINDLIVQHNREHDSSLEPLNTAMLIARTLTHLENLISAFQERGPQAVLPIYYKRWVHSGSVVRLWSEDGPEAAVVGLDDNGFLQVKTAEQGVVSVQPDGNSFDMLRNLVVTKQS
uniref:BPL/LPL catalytic domain-containing protein n=1 Tax=Denticeps clupeoides TaxID=299321 RepID=A0AAY4ENK7_9TELE